jgi:hypothetical protein
MYETLQSIVDQLEFCEYQTKDGFHELKTNAAFIALNNEDHINAVIVQQRTGL